LSGSFQGKLIARHARREIESPGSKNEALPG